jgi:Flp pilus assembly protein TadD
MFFSSQKTRRAVVRLALLAGALASVSELAAQRPSGAARVDGTRNESTTEEGETSSSKSKSSDSRSSDGRINIPPLEAIGDQLRKAFPPQRGPRSSGNRAKSLPAKGASATSETRPSPKQPDAGKPKSDSSSGTTETPESESQPPADDLPGTIEEVVPSESVTPQEETRSYPTVEKRVRRETPMSDAARVAFSQANGAFARSDFREARRLFREAEEIAPGHPLVLTNLGLCEYRMGEADAAEEHLRQAVANDLNSFDAWLTLGIISVERDKLDSALAALSQCVLLEPNDPRSRNYLGVTYSRLGWYDAAEAQLQRAIKLRDEYAEAHFNLAVAYLRREPPAVELARRHYQRSLDLGAPPDDVVAGMLSGSSAK